MENKTEFKKGDEVVTVIYNPYHGIEITETTIKNITPKGIIKTNDNCSFTPSGIYTTTERWSSLQGYILPNNQITQGLVKGYKTVPKINKVLEILGDTTSKVTPHMFKTRQCDTEKLESIINRLNDIQNELSEMVNNK